MIRVAIAGACGRTGRSVIEFAASDDRFEIAGALTSRGCSDAGTTIRVANQDILITDALEAECDVLIDFSIPAGTMAWLEVCREKAIAMVIGVTGHSDDQLARIHEAGELIPIVKASNFSIGIQTLLEVAGSLAKKLGDKYDAEIVEAHHRHKIDAPSGTALALADAIATATGRSRNDVVFGREGRTGERPKGQIGVHAIRMGDIVGQHEVHFSGPGETITLRHAVHSRDPFAAGALRAAAWIIKKPPGLYSAHDSEAFSQSR